jgi:hypothetical protein
MQVRAAVEQLSSLPVDRRRAIARSVRELRKLPSDRRAAALDSPAYSQQFSDQERGTLINLMQRNNDNQLADSREPDVDSRGGQRFHGRPPLQQQLPGERLAGTEAEEIVEGFGVVGVTISSRKAPSSLVFLPLTSRNSDP